MDLWEETEKHEISAELATVRGWIMEAMEYKNPEAFDRYLDNCHIDDNVRNYF